MRTPELHGTDLFPLDLPPSLPWAQPIARRGALHARRRSQGRPFLIGMAGMSAAAVVQFGIVRPNVETALVDRAGIALGERGYQMLEVSAAGRDLTVRGELPAGATPDDVRTALAGITGVRTVRIDQGATAQ